MFIPKYPLCIALATALLLSASNGVAVDTRPRDISASTSIELRLNYLQRLLKSKTGRRLAAEDQQVVTKVNRLLNDAQSALANQQREAADRLVKQGLKTVMAAVRELPAEAAEQQRLKERYHNLRQGLEKFVHAQDRNQKRISDEEGAQAITHYDQALLQKAVASANASAQKGNYEKAINHLKEAQAVVTVAIQAMLNNRALVHKLDLSTPEKEYAYELQRYLSYAELIPAAIEMRRPSPSVISEMKERGEKARWMAEQAREKAISGDYPIAIRMILDATKTVRSSLAMAGVSM